MTAPIPRKGDKVHFSIPVVSSNGRSLGISDILDANKAAKELVANLKKEGIEVLGWGTSSALNAVQINFIIREEPDA